MSRSHEPHRHFIPFGNPFRGILPRGSVLKPKLLTLSTCFEEALSGRLKKLIPIDNVEFLNLSWMKLAMGSLSETHKDIKTLITELELPVYDWDEKWIDLYLDNSVKLLDICIAFSSEISHLNQGHLLLQYALHSLEPASSNYYLFDRWRQHINSKNQKFENCLTILDGLVESLNFPKVKNSQNGKVLMRAMFGVKVFTVFVCSVFIASFSNSAKKMANVQVSGTYLWSDAFASLQTYISKKMTNLFSGEDTIFVELVTVDSSVKKLHLMIQNGIESSNSEAFETAIAGLGKDAERLSRGLNDLANEVDSFFQIVLRGRDALLCNLRGSSSIFDSGLENIGELQSVGRR